MHGRMTALQLLIVQALEEAAHECSNATPEDLERLKDLAQMWIRLADRAKAGSAI